MNFKLIFILLAGILILAGCSTSPQKNNQSIDTKILEPQAMLKFSDVPVPVGFKMILRESYSFQSGGVRVGLLKYHGKANVDQVINFYKEQMPMYNWNLLNIIEFNERLLNFDRDTETCIISLLPKGNNVLLTISIGPKAQTQKKTEKPAR